MGNKDTKDFINKLEKVKSVPKDYQLVTLDVKSLYTTSPINNKKKQCGPFTITINSKQCQQN